MEADLFKDSEENSTEMMKGYDYMIYSVGPDDRVTPKAPAQEFFYDRLVTVLRQMLPGGRKSRASRKRWSTILTSPILMTFIRKLT
jgi:hypothetical protein